MQKKQNILLHDVLIKQKSSNHMVQNNETDLEEFEINSIADTGLALVNP